MNGSGEPITNLKQRLRKNRRKGRGKSGPEEALGKVSRHRGEESFPVIRGGEGEIIEKEKYEIDGRKNEVKVTDMLYGYLHIHLEKFGIKS